MRASSQNGSSSSASQTLTRKLVVFARSGLALWFSSREIQENKEQTVEAMQNVHNVLNAF